MVLYPTGFSQYIVLLLKYQQVPQQLRITATTSSIRDLPPPPPPGTLKWDSPYIISSMVKTGYQDTMFSGW